MRSNRGGGKRIPLSPTERERRIAAILSSLIGDDKTTMQISKVLPFSDVTIRNVLRNLKKGGYVSTHPPICDHHGFVIWMITPKGISRATRPIMSMEVF